MIVTNKPIVSHAALACAAQLTAAIMARLAGNGVSESVAGNPVTRTAVAASALADATKLVRGL